MQKLFRCRTEKNVRKGFANTLRGRILAWVSRFRLILEESSREAKGSAIRNMMCPVDYGGDNESLLRPGPTFVFRTQMFVRVEIPG